MHSFQQLWHLCDHNHPQMIDDDDTKSTRTVRQLCCLTSVSVAFGFLLYNHHHFNNLNTLWVLCILGMMGRKKLRWKNNFSLLLDCPTKGLEASKLIWQHRWLGDPCSYSADCDGPVRPLHAVQHSKEGHDGQRVPQACQQWQVRCNQLICGNVCTETTL